MTPVAARRSLLGNLLAVLIGQAGTWLLTAVTLAILPRYLGPAGLGDVSIGLTIAALASVVAGFGVETFATKEVARGEDSDGTLAGLAIFVALAAGTVTGAVGFAISVAAGYSGTTLVAIGWSCAGVPAIVASATVVAVLQGREMMSWAAAIDVASKVMVLAVAVLVVALDLGLATYLGGFLAVLVTTLVIHLAILTRVHRPSFASVRPKSVRALVVASLPFFAVNVIWVVYTSVDPLILSVFAGSDAVGVYAAPMRIFGTLMFLPVALTTVVFPRLSALHGANEAEFGRFAGQTLRITLLASAIVSVGAVGLSDEVLVGILGEEFARSGPVIVVLALAVLPTAMSMVCVRVAYASDRQRGVSLVGLGALAVRIVLAALLIPFFESGWGNAALGGAVGLLAMECGLALAFTRFLPGELRTPALRAFVLRTLAALMLAFSVVAVLAPAAGSFVAAAVGGVVFILACGALGVMKLGAAPRSLRTRSPAALLGAPGEL